MMNVEEKNDFVAARKKLLEQLQNASGISADKVKAMQKQGITMRALKQLPACQIKALLAADKPTSPGPKTAFGSKKSLPPGTTQPLEAGAEAPNPFGNEFNAEFAKKTLMEHKKMSVQYRTNKLIAKIEEKGSLYGKSAAEVSEAVAEQRKNPQIQAVEGMFNDNKISDQYEGFQRKAVEILGQGQKAVEDTAEVELAHKQQKQAQRKQQSTKKREKQNADPDYDDGDSSCHVERDPQRLDIEVAPKRPPLVMGKVKKQLESTLDYTEKQTLKKAIAAECKAYREAVNAKYHDNFERSIMVDPEDSQIRNEVLRKIKFYKVKKNQLPDFVRKKRIGILTKRAEEEKQMLLNNRS